MEELTKIKGKVNNVLDEASKKIRDAAMSLEVPDVHLLNRRSTLNICAAVAVDTGQSLFAGVLKDVGVALFQVASSQKNDEPRSYASWINPNLPEDERRKKIENQLDELFARDLLVREFVESMGWNKIYEHRVMPPSCYSYAHFEQLQKIIQQNQIVK